MASQNSNYVYRTINTLTGLTTEPVTKPTTAISLTSDDWDLINDLKGNIKKRKSRLSLRNVQGLHTQSNANASSGSVSGDDDVGSEQQDQSSSVDMISKDDAAYTQQQHMPLPPKKLGNVRRSNIEHFLTNSKVKMALNGLLCIDVLLVVIEVGVEAEWNHGTYAGAIPGNAGSCVDGTLVNLNAQVPGLLVISILELVILSCFIAEHVLIFTVLGLEYFSSSQFMMWLDFGAVASSFVTELFLITTESDLPSGVFVLFRLWRFVRIADHTLFNRRIGRIPAQQRRKAIDEEFRKIAFGALQQCIVKGHSFDFAATLTELTGLDEDDLMPLGASISTGNEGMEHSDDIAVLPRELPRDALQLGANLGKGKFGSVMQASLNDVEADLAYPVALKQIAEDAPLEASLDILKEAALMTQLRHANVIRINGVVTVGKPHLVVLEFAPAGALHAYLLKNGTELTHVMKEHMAHNVASGMEYLASKHVLHRDLATRNILLLSDLTCKISDFGLSVMLRKQLFQEGLEDVYELEYVDVDGQTPIPIRWVPPEVLKQHAFSEKSDIWSFGIFLCELYSNGSIPYPHLDSNLKVVECILAGKTADLIPAGIDAELGMLLKECLHFKKANRPDFHTARKKLTRQNDSVYEQLQQQDRKRRAASGAQQSVTLAGEDDGREGNSSGDDDGAFSGAADGFRSISNLHDPVGDGILLKSGECASDAGGIQSIVESRNAFYSAVSPTDDISEAFSPAAEARNYSTSPPNPSTDLYGAGATVDSFQCGISGGGSGAGSGVASSADGTLSVGTADQMHAGQLYAVPRQNYSAIGPGTSASPALTAESLYSVPVDLGRNSAGNDAGNDAGKTGGGGGDVFKPKISIV